MAFDLAGARNAGASDAQIIDHLSQARHFDLAGARAAGAGDQQILDHLMQVPKTSWAQQAPAKSGFWSDPETGMNVAKGVVDVAKGAIKGLGSTVVSMGELGTILFGGLVGAQDRQGTIDAVERMKNTGTLAANNAAQKIGKGAEQIAEFFVPMGLGEKVAVKGVELATKIGTSLAEKTATGAFEMGIRNAMQSGKIDQNTAVAAGVGAALPIIGKGLSLAKDVLPQWSNALEEVNLRLTPVQRRTFTTKIDDVTEYLSKNKMVGTAEGRLNSVIQKYHQMEPELQNFLTTTAKDSATPKSTIISQLENLKTKYQDRVDTDVIESRIDRVIKNIETKQPDAVSVISQNNLKRSAYSTAYNNAGNEVFDDVMHDIGGVFQTNIEKSTEGMKINGKDIASFNKEYGTIINARKLLSVAASRKDVGFTAKILSSLVGGAVGSAVGGPVGTAVGAAIAPRVAETVAGTFPRSAVAAGLRTMSEKSLPKGAATLVKGIVNQTLKK